MNKRQKTFCLYAFVSILLILSAVVCSGCQSSKQETVSAAENSMATLYRPEKENSAESSSSKNEKTSSAQKESPTEIKIDKKNVSYFSSIDQTVISEIEKGSPQSIRTAVSRLRKATIDYSENERILFNIASSIMSLVWKSEKQLQDVPPVTEEKYLGIISSAKIGVFEKNSESNDFFQIVLPCLALISDSVRQEDFPQIQASLQQGLKIKPDSVLCNYLMGLLNKRQENYDSAILFFDKATEQNFIVYEILLEKANCLIQLKKYEQVSNILDKLVIQYPSDIKIYKLYANTAFLMKDFVKAEQYASLVLQQNPSDLEFVLFRAKIFVETGEYLKASSLLDVYSKIYPDNREYLLLRSKIQREWNKNITLAIATIERALSLYPKDLEIILYAAELASVSNRKVNNKTGGQLAAAILQIDEKNVDALSISVLSLYNEEKFLEAYSLSKKILEIKPLPQNAVSMHIKVCLALKYNDEAWKYALTLYEKDQNDPEFIKIYIEVMIKTGRTANALRLINSMLNNSPAASMKSFLFYQRSFLQNSDTASLSDLRSSLIANPRNSDALFRMYEIYYNRKDYRKAQYYLKQVVSLNPNEEKYIRLNSEIEQLIK